jgi:processive 1,2-diacylglycerol beta-glucosyltransferase
VTGILGQWLRRNGKRRGTVLAAGLVVLAWFGIVAVTLGVAGNLRAAQHTGKHPNGVYLLVAVDASQPLPQATIDRMAALHAAAAISTPVLRAQPQTVRALAKAGVVIVNAGGGTGVASGKAIGQAAGGITAVTGHSPRLLVSDGRLDPLAVGVVTMHREHIVVPAVTMRCGATVLPALKGLVLIEAPGDCDLSGTLQRLSQLTPARPISDLNA